MWGLAWMMVVLSVEVVAFPSVWVGGRLSFGGFCIGLMPHSLVFRGGAVRFFVCSDGLFGRRQVGLSAVLGIAVGAVGLDVATRLWLCS